jgi:hypothetical protein
MKTGGISPGTSKIPEGEKNVQLGLGVFQQPVSSAFIAGGILALIGAAATLILSRGAIGEVTATTARQPVGLAG